MLYFNRIDVSEGIDVNEISASKEFDICHYCYLLSKGLTFQPNVYTRCHDLLIMPMNLSDIAILNIKGFDSENDKLSENAGLNGKSGTL